MISELLKAWRLAGGYSVREAAKIIGVSAATYHRIEDGKAIDVVTLLRLVNLLFDH